MSDDITDAVSRLRAWLRDFSHLRSEAFAADLTALLDEVERLQDAGPPPDRERDYEDERHCDHCRRDTLHACRDSGHKRDSSGDMQTCKVCGWWKSGMSDRLYPLIGGGK